jgi:uncharacterized membrane protein
MTVRPGLERSIGLLLRLGVGASVLVVVVGTLLSFRHHPDYVSVHDALAPLRQPAPHSLGLMLRGIEHRQGRAVVMLGLLLLIATPVVRVAMSLAFFVARRDRAFVVLSTLVLLFLVLSFVLGRALS